MSMSPDFSLFGLSSVFCFFVDERPVLFRFVDFGVDDV